MRPIERLMRKLKLRGAGDAVALVAQPIAKAIDRVAGTNVSGCAGCQQRRDRLNERFPINQEPLDSPQSSH